MAKEKLLQNLRIVGAFLALLIAYAGIVGTYFSTGEHVKKIPGHETIEKLRETFVPEDVHKVMFQSIVESLERIEKKLDN